MERKQPDNPQEHGADGVRIIGAEPAAGSGADHSVGGGSPAAGESAGDHLDDDGAEDDDTFGGDPAPTGELPHWAQPPAAPKPVHAEGVDEPSDDGTWAGFAGAAPRWRDQASDWADVDEDDHSLLSDDEIRVGTLDPDRSDESDVFAFAEVDEHRRGASRRDEPAAVDPADVRRVSARAGTTAPQTRGARPGVRRRSDSAAPGAAGAVEGVANMGTRIGTGLILLLALGICWVLKEKGLALLVTVAAAAGASELCQAARQIGAKPAVLIGLIGTASMCGATYWRGFEGITVALMLVVLVTMLWFLLVEHVAPVLNAAVTLLAVGYVGVLASTAMLLLRSPAVPKGQARNLLLAAVLCTVATDIGGFFGGRAIGRTALSSVSPGKTVEGLLLGLLASVAVAVVIQRTVSPWNATGKGLALAVGLGVAVGIAAPLGDLCESMLKRDLDLKDMGNLLPGHGGVLDRIDGMLFAIPAVFLVARFADFV